MEQMLPSTYPSSQALRAKGSPGRAVRQAQGERPRHSGFQHDNLGDETSTQTQGTAPHSISPARGEKFFK
jgi:hypothetical protein